MSQGELNFTPDYEQAFGLLKHLNSEELNQLLNNEEKLHSMIKDLQQVKNIEIEREMLLASNKSLSEFNLSQKPILDDARKQLEELYNMASELKTELMQKKAKLEHVKDMETPDTILALLQTATAEIEDETEEYVNRFLDGETPIKTFLEEYLEKRKLAHLRRAKSEKMALLLQTPDSRKSPPTRPPRPNRQKPPAPTTPVLNAHGVRAAGMIPPVPSNSVGPSFWAPVPVVPSRPAPQPPQRLPTGNEILQGINNTHITAPYPPGPSYMASCSQPVNFNVNRPSPYPFYPAAIPFTPSK